MQPELSRILLFWQYAELRTKVALGWRGLPRPEAAKLCLLPDVERAFSEAHRQKTTNICLKWCPNAENSRPSTAALKLQSTATSLRRGYRTNGLVLRSVPTFVGAPWPGRTVTSSPSANNFLLIPVMSTSVSPPGKSPRPMLPEKRTSPPMSNLSCRKKKQRLPGQWPGISRTWKSSPRKFRFGVSSIRKSGSTGSISSANPKLRKNSRSEIIGAVSG